MLTTAQAGHFSMFGFTVLRGFLADRAAALRAETGAAVRDAAGRAAGTVEGPGGRAAADR